MFLNTPPSCLGMISNYRTAQSSRDKELYKENVIISRSTFPLLSYEYFPNKAPEGLPKPPAYKTECFKEVNSGVEFVERKTRELTFHQIPPNAHPLGFLWT